MRIIYASVLIHRASGKMSKSTILSGFSALKASETPRCDVTTDSQQELSEVLADPDGDLAKSMGGSRRAVEDLTSRYYSYVTIHWLADTPSLGLTSRP